MERNLIETLCSVRGVVINGNTIVFQTIHGGDTVVLERIKFSYDDDVRPPAASIEIQISTDPLW